MSNEDLGRRVGRVVDHSASAPELLRSQPAPSDECGYG
jgi:hypothetical protein